jgi:TolB-like protein
MPDPDSSANEPKSADDVSLLAQLKDRRVFRSAIAYAVVAWGATEILDGVISGLGWPDWLATLAVILFVMGFPVAMFLAWVFDWTPGGIRRTAPAGAMGWLQILAAAVFLVAGSAGLFWLINPSGIAHAETVGVAVLPCRYQGDPRYAYRGEGFAEVLNAGLAYSKNLFVPDFGSVLALSAQNLGTAALGDRLSVSWLIECRVSEMDKRLTIDTSMVDVSTDESSALTRSSVASLTIPETLRNLETDIFNRLGIPHDRDVWTQSWASLTSSLSAFDDYLLGLRDLRDGTPDSIRRARRHFRAAHHMEDFPMARIGEADAMIALLESEPPESASERASTLAAVELILEALERHDPVPAELYASRLRFANVSDRLGSQQSASEPQRREWFERATKIRPSYAEPFLLYATFLESHGRGDEAADYLASARQLAPAPE